MSHIHMDGCPQDTCINDVVGDDDYCTDCGGNGCPCWCPGIMTGRRMMLEEYRQRLLYELDSIDKVLAPLRERAWLR